MSNLTTNSTYSQTEVKLTSKQFDILQLTATHDKMGIRGIPGWAHRHFKPGSKRVLNALTALGLVEFDVHHYAVPTDLGQRVYDAALESEADHA